MAIQTWRRHHGHTLVATVIGRTPETYAVAVWDEASGTVHRLQKELQRLHSAKAAADDLIRRTFRHTCTLEACGQWLIWTV